MVEKERREEHEATKKRHTHADDVRTQIRQKEALRVMERNQFFEEGVKLDEEARHRRLKLEDVKKKKLNELRYLLKYMVLKIFNLHIVGNMNKYSTCSFSKNIAYIHIYFYSIFQ